MHTKNAEFMGHKESLVVGLKHWSPLLSLWAVIPDFLLYLERSWNGTLAHILVHYFGGEKKITLYCCVSLPASALKSLQEMEVGLLLVS